MSDKQIYRVNERWAIAYDQNQWILQRFEGVRRKGSRIGKEMWRGVSFVTSTKQVLARCMREKGVPNKDATKALAFLPDTFSEFLAKNPIHSWEG